MRSPIAILSLATLAALSSTAPAHGRECPDGLEDFQSRLEILVADFYRAADLAQGLEATGAEMLRQSVAELEDAVAEATPEQLAAVCGLFSRHPDLAEAPRMLESVAQAAPAAATSCLVLTHEQFLGVFVTSQVLKVVAAGLQTACEATECITLACRITCALAGVANGAVLVFDSILEENDYCGKSFHFEIVEELAENTVERLTALEEALETEVIAPLDRPLSSRASQTSVDLLQQSVGNGLAAADDRVAAAAADLAAQGEDRQSFQGGSLRQRIEANLQAGDNGRIVRFQLPASVGGLLEEVREVVAQTLLDNVAAGHQVGDAFELFAAGDTALNSQAYKTAFGFYRESYRAAVDSTVLDDGEAP